MAKSVGNTGRVWLFEPTSRTADCLDDSIKANGLSNVVLVRAGLSNKTGEARFFLCENSELNGLTRIATSQRTEVVKLVTLDSCFDRYKWRKIDFIKLDAEGEEDNILKKARTTLTSLSPLIMFELKHRDAVNAQLVSKFKSFSYDCYRLLPGPNTLVPFHLDAPFDDRILNLFCCKEDMAQKLERAGLLVRDGGVTGDIDSNAASKYLSRLEYWKTLKDTVRFPDAEEPYARIVNMYVLSLSRMITRRAKVAYLMAALEEMRKSLESKDKRIEHMTTFSRIAFDAGERRPGVEILSGLIDKYRNNLNFEIREPFLPACKRYETLPPQADIRTWLFASIIEQYIIKHSFSCYFSGAHTLPVFEELAHLGFLSDEMQRRYDLVRQVFQAA